MTPVFAKAYRPEEIHFTLDDCDNRIEPRKVMMCTPDFFDIKDVKNVHMTNNPPLNKEIAKKQWDALRKVYENFQTLGIIDEVLIVNGVEECEDMVFCANQSFPWVLWNGEKIVVMSNMKHESRQTEVIYFEDFYKDISYKIFNMQSRYHFEGMGDLIAHPGKKLLYGGYGYRSERNAYDEICRMLDAPIITLELVNDSFYHLDTCFLPLNNTEVIVAPDAFSFEAMQIIRRMFEGVYEIPLEEALKGFACNAHMIYNAQKNKSAAIIQRGNPVTLNLLQQCATQVIEVDTSEFIKSGGSVFCMKMMVY